MVWPANRIIKSDIYILFCNEAHTVLHWQNKDWRRCKQVRCPLMTAKINNMFYILFLENGMQPSDPKLPWPVARVARTLESGGVAYAGGSDATSTAAPEEGGKYGYAEVVARSSSASDSGGEGGSPVRSRRFS